MRGSSPRKKSAIPVFEKLDLSGKCDRNTIFVVLGDVNDEVTDHGADKSNKRSKKASKVRVKLSSKETYEKMQHSSNIHPTNEDRWTKKTIIVSQPEKGTLLRNKSLEGVSGETNDRVPMDEMKKDFEFYEKGSSKQTCKRIRGHDGGTAVDCKETICPERYLNENEITEDTKVSKDEDMESCNKYGGGDNRGEAEHFEKEDINSDESCFEKNTPEAKDFADVTDALHHGEGDCEDDDYQEGCCQQRRGSQKTPKQFDGAARRSHKENIIDPKRTSGHETENLCIIKKASKQLEEKESARNMNIPCGGKALTSVNPEEDSAGNSLVKTNVTSVSPTLCLSSRKMVRQSVNLSFKMGLTSESVSEMVLQTSPLAEPERSLQEALRRLDMEDWVKKMSGMKTIACLAVHHPQNLALELITVNQALAKELKNLRSQVCRAAVQTIGVLFIYMKRLMESDLELSVGLLLQKTGEANKFLREDSLGTLLLMVKNISPQKSLTVLYTEGANHRNALVRMTAARLLAIVVDNLGPSRVFNGSKDSTEKLLSMSSKFLQEGKQETRNFAKRIFKVLLENPDFEKIFDRHVPDKTRRNIKKPLLSLGAKLRDP